MDLKAICEFVNTHPQGVLIRMIDGTEYRIPHRDYVWFTPSSAEGDSADARLAKSFCVAFEGVGRLVNATLVADIVPLSKNGDGTRKNQGRGRKSR